MEDIIYSSFTRDLYTNSLKEDYNLFIYNGLVFIRTKTAVNKQPSTNPMFKRNILTL